MVVDDGELELRADKALLVCFQGELSKLTVYKSKIFLEIPNVNAFLLSLSGRDKDTESIFETLDIKLPDGTYPSIQTHDPRHFLNTMAQRAGVPQEIIAAWSGRWSVAQNAVYNHMTPVQKMEQITKTFYEGETKEELINRVEKEKFKGVIIPSTDILTKEDADYKEIRKQTLVSATPLGNCVGRLIEEPCPNAVICTSCSSFMIVKGNKENTKKLEDNARVLNNQFQKLEEKFLQGSPSVTREQLDHYEAISKGANEMVQALHDPETPNGDPVFRMNHTGAAQLTFTKRFIEQQKERLAVNKQEREIPDA